MFEGRPGNTWDITLARPIDCYWSFDKIVHCGPRTRDGIVSFRASSKFALGEWHRDTIKLQAVHHGDVTILIYCELNNEIVCKHTINLRVSANT